MSAYDGSVWHLRKMAERCRRAAQDLGNAEEVKQLLAVARGCEEKARTREHAMTAIASEED